MANFALTTHLSLIGFGAFAHFDITTDVRILVALLTVTARELGEIVRKSAA
tara:strand:- start:631 stop:783 length:153 start_codon:yes stop_codon:yes gene_type:complete